MISYHEDIAALVIHGCLEYAYTLIGGLDLLKDHSNLESASFVLPLALYMLFVQLIQLCGHLSIKPSVHCNS
jgi:hypothetical protein